MSRTRGCSTLRSSRTTCFGLKVSVTICAFFELLFNLYHPRHFLSRAVNYEVQKPAGNENSALDPSFPHPFLDRRKFKGELFQLFFRSVSFAFDLRPHLAVHLHDNDCPP